MESRWSIRCEGWSNNWGLSFPSNTSSNVLGSGNGQVEAMLPTPWKRRIIIIIRRRRRRRVANIYATAIFQGQKGWVIFWGWPMSMWNQHPSPIHHVFFRIEEKLTSQVDWPKTMLLLKTKLVFLEKKREEVHALKIWSENNTFEQHTHVAGWKQNTCATAICTRRSTKRLIELDSARHWVCRQRGGFPSFNPKNKRHTRSLDFPGERRHGEHEKMDGVRRGYDKNA